VRVCACLGHLRDLPKGKLGVDVAQGFRPDYQIMPNREKTVQELRQAIRQAERVLLATDPDREGEAVAWHVSKVCAAELQGKRVERVSFNAITRQAVQAALAFPRSLDTRLVQAAVARRVLDRLVGYVLSPQLWQAVKGRDHSAGRVQSVALRFLAEHSREKPSHWTVEVKL
jgi:DNA topoisomerase-1